MKKSKSWKTTEQLEKNRLLPKKNHKSKKYYFDFLKFLLKIMAHI